MNTLFKSSTNFASLSLKDLIEARDLFHYHLMNKENVVATALGLYRIRKDDPWPDKDHPVAKHNRKPRSERRTLFNSEVRPYSWPCVYVFVSKWKYEADLSRSDPSDVVPKSLFLPDGRSVPVCVIEAQQQHYAADLQVRLDSRTPRNLLGPGIAIVNKNGQGMERIGTAGCIVRDGERYYVLTNRHVVGETGTTINALQSHREPEIGVTAKKGLTREDFGTVYPHFRSSSQRLLMDIGLVEIDNVLDWKTDVPGIAPLGPVLDLYDNSLTLKLITMKVVGLSAISGPIRGEIHGLFYRYKAMGGSEYISDFLIGPETYGNDPDLEKKKKAEEKNPALNIGLGVHHGDSGTLLFIEHEEAPESQAGKKAKSQTIYYPFALLWGKEEFFDDTGLRTRPYALATSLSTALDRLDLDLVRDINVDQNYIWGWVGHYTIGRALSLPLDLLTSKKLQQFIDKNIDLLSLKPDAALKNDPKVIVKGDSKAHFVPLADVPDNVWKSNVNVTIEKDSSGKRTYTQGPGSRGQNDNKNHFADLDFPYKNGATFLELNYSDPDTYLNPRTWKEYFAEIEPQFTEWAKLLKNPKKKEAADGSGHWGALPFRVHQLFDIMVDAARKGNESLFLCAGGVLIHYIGDACQPLHASYLSQGDPARVVKRPTADTMIYEADGVHSGYEDDMIAYGYQSKDLADALSTRITELKNESIADITSGYDASKAVIALIHATQKDISPRAIVDKWVELKRKGEQKKDKAKAMWDRFGDDTVTCMARGTRYLAKIWQSAWDLGNGDRNIGSGSEIKAGTVSGLYNNPDVMPSVGLDQYPDDKDADWSKIKRRPPQTAAKPKSTKSAAQKKPKPAGKTKPAAKKKRRKKR